MDGEVLSKSDDFRIAHFFSSSMVYSMLGHTLLLMHKTNHL